MRISWKKLAAAAAVVLAAAAGTMICLRYRAKTFATVRFHMDTFISYYVGSVLPERTVDAMDKAVEDCEDLFDRFSADSEISRVNANAGTMTEVSEETYLLVEDAIKLAAETGGYFDPTVGKISDIWGFGIDPHVPEKEEIAAALQYVGFGRVMLEEKNGQYYVCVGEGQSLDLGGIAKGYALRKVREAAEKAGCRFAVVSFGGNVLLVGAGHDGNDGFSVGIRTPEENITDPALIISLEGGVVSTSGGYERFFMEDGVRYCHIIDPFTGNCAGGDLLSVSVICDDPVRADCLSTAYFVKGLDSTLDALASGEFSGIAIDSDKVIYISEDLAGSVAPEGTADGYRIEVVG
ncbi:MAG: FAD:protein FMN transferase [Oscillospiraceae bacterium]|nr:FAD:protein FMN transferase [Oscillospiraceae bacterium]